MVSVYLNFTNNCQIVFLSDYAIFQSKQQSLRVPFAVCSHKHLIYSIFKILSLIDMSQYHIVILVCISLTMLNVLQVLILPFVYTVQ